TVNVYIDPSGLVRTPEGTGIPGVTMTLFRSDSPNGPFVQVPNGSAIMAPYNRNNPDKTGTMGNFGWDVIAGYYKVRAEKAGCVSAANPGQSFVETHVMTIPPPVTDLDLRLSCPGGPLSGLPVKVTVTNDWGAGYCADVKVTNPTAATIAVWEASFAATGTIYSSWNAAFSKSGNTVTARGQGWNAALAPGQSTHSVGFCANR
ncbi:MAG TPA: cellulose binding domain-containing protein, partial [Herpetosiphonaceae bacterium]|nr:cellulose binding domain-containing protein [Herpetosiphonaceae bacterium]